MSKRNKKKHGKSKGVATKPSPDAITTAESRTGITSTPTLAPPPSRDRWLLRRWIIFGAFAVAAIVGWGLYEAHRLRYWPFHEREEVIQGQLIDEDHEVIDRFVALRQRKDAAAFGLLAPLPGGDDPVSEEEFERRAANEFLRKKDVRIVAVRPGEPDEKGKQRRSPRRFALVTEGKGPTPSLRVKRRDGKVMPESYFLNNPVVIVEVQGDVVRRIQPLRAEINKP